MIGDKIKDLNIINDEPEIKDLDLVSNIFGQYIENNSITGNLNKNKHLFISALTVSILFIIFNSNIYSSFITKYIKNNNYKNIFTVLVIFLSSFLYFYLTKYMLKED